MVQSSVLFSNEEIRDPLLDELIEAEDQFIRSLQDFTGRTDEQNRATANFVNEIAELESQDQVRAGLSSRDTATEKTRTIPAGLLTGILAGSILLSSLFSGGQEVDEKPSPAPVPVLVAPPTSTTTEYHRPTETKISTSAWNAVRDQQDEIALLRPAYEEAARRTGVSWQLVATLHYREANNASNRSIFAGEVLGTSNPDHHTVMPTSQVENFVAGINHFKSNALTFYGVEIGMENSEDELAEAFLAYNRGHMYLDHGLTPEDSPYVMSGMNSELGGMSFPNSPGETVPGFVENRVGALPFYLAIS